MDLEKRQQRALERFKAFYESEDYQNSQQGGAVVTRNQAKNKNSVENVTQSQNSVITSTKRKLEDVVRVSKKTKTSEDAYRVQSPVAGTSSSFQHKPFSPQAAENDEVQMDYEGEDSEPELFDRATTVYEDDNLQVFVVKEMFKRQKIFRIEDHSYVMRIKLKNKKSEYPMLDSLMDVLYTAFTFMINNLKTFIPKTAEEDNLIYLCIHQQGMTNSLNSGSFKLQSVETETLVQDVLLMFENYVNSDSTINVLDNSFKCYFRVLSVPHVNYSKHRRKTIPQPERVPSRLGCRLNRRFLISNKSGLYDIPGIKIQKLLLQFIFIFDVLQVKNLIAVFFFRWLSRK